MKRITDFFLRNVGWKLLSLVLAAVLWFVSTNVNDPTQNKGYDTYLTILNQQSIAQSNMVLLNEMELLNTVVSIRVRAAKSVLERLYNDRAKIKAYIDLKPIDISYADKVGEPQSLSVMLDMPDYINIDDMIISRDPPAVQILLDKYVKKTIPIVVEPVGIPAEGYLGMEPKVSPNSITVRGAKSDIDRIDSVSVQVSLQDVTSTIEKTADIVIMDNEKSNITSMFDLDIKETHVEVQIYKYKSVPVRAIYTGNLASGYRISSVSVEPEEVQVVGDEDELETLKAITLTPAVNLDGASSVRSKVYDVRELLINTGLSIRNNTPYEVTVNVKTERETVKEIIIPTERIKVVGIDYAVDLPSELKLVVRGSALEVDKLNADNIEGYIDLTGLMPGEHEVVVTFDLPADVAQLGEPATMTVTINASEETAPEEED